MPSRKKYRPRPRRPAVQMEPGPDLPQALAGLAGTGHERRKTLPLGTQVHGALDVNLGSVCGGCCTARSLKQSRAGGPEIESPVAGPVARRAPVRFWSSFTLGGVLRNGNSPSDTPHVHSGQAEA